MALETRGDHSYGETQADLRDEIADYARNGYPPAHFADAVCTCGGRVFRLLLDDTEGVAVRVCAECAHEHPIGDSADFAEEAELEECACPCTAEAFEITVGVALYAESDDVRWLYVGCRCVACGLLAVYGDWKNEYEGYRELLARV